MEEKLINYFGLHLSVNVVPLSYVIRDGEPPDQEGLFLDFRSKTIVCALLIGEYIDADKKAAFNMIVSFSTGKPSGD